MFRLEDYDYHLPDHLISQQPEPRRDQCRLLVLERTSGRLRHMRFFQLVDILNPGDVLVVNDTRVVPARLYGKKEGSGGKVEVLVLDYAQGVASGTFTCLVRAGKAPRPGTRLVFSPRLRARVLGRDDAGFRLAFEAAGDLQAALEQVGVVPLPPYIRRPEGPSDPKDVADYQTVYASNPGAVAAPTAGLHFTDGLLERLEARGVAVARLTLHVGYGTFAPVRSSDIRRHRMHAEWYHLPRQAAETIARARRAGGRVVAVGTTCVRTLEHCAGPDGLPRAGRGWCDLFIYPGYRFCAVDAMITNFHLPRSTLLMLVAAFAGRDTVLAAYRQAVQMGYRFYSYGDAMLLC